MIQKKSNAVDVQIGQIVRARRLAKRLSQTELGEVLGLTFQQVQKYEKGSNRISASRLAQIAEALEVPIGIFYRGIGTSGKNDADLSTIEPFSLLRSSLGIRLLRAFHELSDQRTREAFVQLAEQIAKREIGRRGSSA